MTSSPSSMLRAPLCTLSLLLAVCLAACGHTVSVGANGTLKMGLSEYRLAPQDVRAHAGELAILAHNYGRLTHNLVITSGDEQLAHSGPIPPGQSVWLYVLVTPGRYGMVSNLLSDQALGMYGTLTVVG